MINGIVEPASSKMRRFYPRTDETLKDLLEGESDFQDFHINPGLHYENYFTKPVTFYTEDLDITFYEKLNFNGLYQYNLDCDSQAAQSDMTEHRPVVTVNPKMDQNKIHHKMKQLQKNNFLMGEMGEKASGLVGNVRVTNGDSRPMIGAVTLYDNRVKWKRPASSREKYMLERGNFSVDDRKAHDLGWGTQWKVIGKVKDRPEGMTYGGGRGGSTDRGGRGGDGSGREKWFGKDGEYLLDRNVGGSRRGSDRKERTEEGKVGNGVLVKRIARGVGGEDLVRTIGVQNSERKVKNTSGDALQTSRARSARGIPLAQSGDKSPQIQVANH
jgi:hypothetical protein